MHNNEAIILNEKIIQLTQQQIASTLKCSKMKVNSMFGRLQKESFVEQRARGKYVLTEKADKSSEEKINKPIMLLGKIQSGKTRVYTRVIALAFDNGFDYDTLIKETIEALHEIVKAGKVRALGASAMYGYQFYNMQMVAKGKYDKMEQLTKIQSQELSF